MDRGHICIFFYLLSYIKIKLNLKVGSEVDNWIQKPVFTGVQCNTESNFIFFNINLYYYLAI